MSTVVHEPRRELDDPKELLLGFLDYYRSVIIRKIGGRFRDDDPRPLPTLAWIRTTGRRGGSAPVLR